ncbi:hypothetical protein HYC85_022580 [Camellia sinensis]|uniref:Uncharacterized protein n=1 Tax=Camellia sinensis TaxID=4442 RepID=A0A7J7GEG5_CAMSI|nr:hypothetical protein HYC85_022580 [Camellia sinensis]
MGSPVYASLEILKLMGNSLLVLKESSRVCVEEIACGAYHVAVLTSRTEVYTWAREQMVDWVMSFKQGESHSSKRNKKLEFSSSRVSPIPNGSSQWGALNISKSLIQYLGHPKSSSQASVPGSRIVSRATSPISRRPSPPRSTTPTPTLGGLTSPKIGVG